VKRIAPLVIAAALVALPAPARAQDKDKLEDSPYYPTKVGSTWTYKAPNGTIVNKIVKHEKVGDVLCAKVETSLDGATQASEHIRVTKDGIYRHSINGIAIEPPVLIMKLPPKKDDTWEVKSKLGNQTISGKMVTQQEKIEVPAGKYEAFVGSATLEAMGQKVDVANYFVKDVGIVKVRMGVMGQTVELELTKFEAGK
jgi:hypothetical protein